MSVQLEELLFYRRASVLSFRRRCARLVDDSILLVSQLKMPHQSRKPPIWRRSLHGHFEGGYARLVDDSIPVVFNSRCLINPGERLSGQGLPTAILKEGMLGLSMSQSYLFLSSRCLISPRSIPAKGLQTAILKEIMSDLSMIPC